MLTSEIDRKSFKFLTEKVPDIIDVFDYNLIRLYINPAITNYTGVQADFYVGKPISDNPYFEDLASHYINLVKQALDSGSSARSEMTFKTLIGIRYFELLAFPQLTGNSINKIFLIFRDVTEIKEKEFMLNRLINRFSTAAEALLQPFVILSPVKNESTIIDFEYDYINEIGSIVNGIPKNETIGKKLLDLFPMHKEMGTFDAFCTVYESGIPYKGIVEYNGRAGAGNLKGYFNISAAKIEEGLVVAWQDITDIKTAQDEIKKSEERLFIAFNSNPVSMLLTDSTGIIINVNRRFRQLLGYSKKEVIGKTINGLDLFGDPAIHKMITMSIKVKDAISRYSTTINDKAGSVLDVILSSVPLEASGNLNFLFTFVDVTKQKQLEKSLLNSIQEKDVLLKEIHHRVKNNLQIISSLLNLQSSVTESREAQDIIAETQNRVQSIALMHENLYRNKSLSLIKLDDYLSGMINRLHNSFCPPEKVVNTYIEAEGINIGLKQCLSIGLIINELVTNCYKYAFLKKQTGEIKIKANLKGKKNLEIMVSDDGEGLPPDLDINQPATLGLQLVSILSNQLDGKIRCRNNNGAEFTIVIPLDDN